MTYVIQVISTVKGKETSEIFTSDYILCVREKRIIKETTTDN